MNLVGRVKFALHAKNLVEQGLQKDKPFRLLTEFGELTMMPAKYAPELRVDPRLDASAVIDMLKETVMMLIARMSARIFLGDEGARNEAWLKITREYTTNGYIASAILRIWPKALRPLVNMILPKCHQLRAQVMEARKIVNEIIDRRRKIKADALRQGLSVPVFNDAVEWWEQDTKDESDKYDPVIGQLVLAQSSIHTTTDFLTQVILDIAANPEVKGPLIAEIKQAKSTYGWSKSALYSMRLTESVMKESQRMKPIARCTMNRMVLADMNLSDGTLLKKGTLLGVSVDRMWDGSVYENPQKWDGWRFYRKYQQCPEARDVPIVNTEPNYLAWGYGRLACAGRFFVTQEAKVALANLLLKYDWEIVSSPSDTKISEFGLVLASNPKARIRWTILGTTFFGPHYNEVAQRHEILLDDPTNEEVKSEIMNEEMLIGSSATRSRIRDKIQAAAKASAAAMNIQEATKALGATEVAYTMATKAAELAMNKAMSLRYVTNLESNSS
ncbi:cytochrome P450 [Curvularia clavata]|uniref:Cytochrome P450 n=1 Tax=Curvularia clavata TaxID=95742 RepID=A0A9Q8Z4I7_CURCL|nr:cytochrome P450 [Curvularia clavata]